MLHVLGIILICLLSILGFLIAVLLLALFLPVFYKLDILYHSGGYSVTIRGKWMAGVLSYKGILTKKGYRNFFMVFGNLKTKSKKKKKKNSKQNKPIVEITEETGFAPEPVHEKEAVKKENTIETPESVKTDETFEGPASEEAKKKKKKKKKKTEADPGERIRNILSYIRDTENRKSYIFAKARLFELLRHIRPKRIKGIANVGFEDPAVTGQVLGVVGVLFGFIGRGIRIEPDFEKKVLSADVHMSGRIRVLNVLIIFLRCHYNKQFRKSVEDISGL